jgi:hypothetical protein
MLLRLLPIWGLLLIGMLAPRPMAAQCPAPVFGTPLASTNSIAVNWSAVPAATIGYQLS